MPSVAPLGHTELFNELMQMAPIDTARAAQVAWRVRAYLNKNRSDLRARVVLVQALVQQGEAAEARFLANELWDSRARLGSEEVDALYSQLVGVGEYERALELMSLPISRSTETEAWLVNRQIQLAWYVGDSEKIKNLIGSRSDVNTWKAFITSVDTAGYLSHLHCHQDIVRAKLRDKQAFVMLSIGKDDDAESSFELSQISFVKGDYQSRMSLEESIYSELSGYYDRNGFKGDGFWHLMTPMVMDLAARQPVKNSDLRLTNI